VAEGEVPRSGTGPGDVPAQPDLDEAVRRTAGVQPGRRAFHATGGLLIAWLLVSDGFGRSVVVPLLAAALAIALALDWLRLRSPAANVRFFRALRLLASPRERDRVASSTWYLVGVLATILLAPTSYAVSAILVLALADPAASVVGRLWGRHPLGSGTVLGTVTFATVATLVLAARHPLPLAIGVALLVSVAEALDIRVDDNLRVPLATGLALMVLGTGLG